MRDISRSGSVSQTLNFNSNLFISSDHLIFVDMSKATWLIAFKYEDCPVSPSTVTNSHCLLLTFYKFFRFDYNTIKIIIE